MARDTIAFIEQVVGGPVRILGCSDGAVVGLHVAWLRPDLVSRLAFVAGVFHHTGWLPGVIDSEEELPEFMAASYGEVSPDGVEHFPVVVEKLNRMHLIDPTMTVDNLSKIPVRTLVMQGDDDQVAFEHALDLYRSLPDAELAIVPWHLTRPIGRKAGPLQRDPSRLSLQRAGDHLRADPPRGVKPRAARPHLDALPMAPVIPDPKEDQELPRPRRRSRPGCAANHARETGTVAEDLQEGLGPADRDRRAGARRGAVLGLDRRHPQGLRRALVPAALHAAHGRRASGARSTATTSPG